MTLAYQQSTVLYLMGGEAGGKRTVTDSKRWGGLQSEGKKIGQIPRHDRAEISLEEGPGSETFSTALLPRVKEGSMDQ